jgi:hypothetical protein
VRELGPTRITVSPRTQRAEKVARTYIARARTVLGKLVMRLDGTGPVLSGRDEFSFDDGRVGGTVLVAGHQRIIAFRVSPDAPPDEMECESQLFSGFADGVSVDPSSEESFKRATLIGKNDTPITSVAIRWEDNTPRVVDIADKEKDNDFTLDGCDERSTSVSVDIVDRLNYPNSVESTFVSTQSVFCVDWLRTYISRLARYEMDSGCFTGLLRKFVAAKYGDPATDLSANTHLLNITQTNHVIIDGVKYYTGARRCNAPYQTTSIMHRSSDNAFHALTIGEDEVTITELALPRCYQPLLDELAANDDDSTLMIVLQNLEPVQSGTIPMTTFGLHRYYERYPHVTSYGWKANSDGTKIAVVGITPRNGADIDTGVVKATVVYSRAEKIENRFRAYLSSFPNPSPFKKISGVKVFAYSNEIVIPKMEELCTDTETDTMSRSPIYCFYDNDDDLIVATLSQEDFGVLDVKYEENNCTYSAFGNQPNCLYGNCDTSAECLSGWHAFNAYQMYFDGLCVPFSFDSTNFSFGSASRCSSKSHTSYCHSRDVSGNICYNPATCTCCGDCLLWKSPSTCPPDYPYTGTVRQFYNWYGHELNFSGSGSIHKTALIIPRNNAEAYYIVDKHNVTLRYGSDRTRYSEPTYWESCRDQYRWSGGCPGISDPGSIYFCKCPDDFVLQQSVAFGFNSLENSVQTNIPDTEYVKVRVHINNKKYNHKNVNDCTGSEEIPSLVTLEVDNVAGEYGAGSGGSFSCPSPAAPVHPENLFSPFKQKDRCNSGIGGITFDCDDCGTWDGFLDFSKSSGCSRNYTQLPIISAWEGPSAEVGIYHATPQSLVISDDTYEGATVHTYYSDWTEVSGCFVGNT